MTGQSHADDFCLGVLASHTGTNFQAILDRCLGGTLSARVGIVISNNSASQALVRARKVNIPVLHLSSQTHPDPAALDQAMTEAMQSHGVDLVVLAGYMKKLGQRLLSAFPNRVLNIHPALLPSFGGKGMYGSHVHEAVIASGARVSGATVHLANSEYDRGPIVAQEVVPVLSEDSAETLAARVLKVEHQIYSRVIQWFAEGRVDVRNGRVFVADSIS